MSMEIKRRTKKVREREREREEDDQYRLTLFPHTMMTVSLASIDECCDISDNHESRDSKLALSPISYTNKTPSVSL